MSFRAWLSVITIVLIVVVVFFSRHELAEAWRLLSQVNIWILLLLIPGQVLVYFAAGEMMFSYLRAKGSISHIPGPRLVRMALEMNFVNHILPSGGVSGISYMTWRLGKDGVSAGRATMAQVVRYAMGFVAMIVLIALSVLIVTIDGNINRWIILVSALLVGGMVSVIVGAIYLLSSGARIAKFSNWLVRTVNNLVSAITFGKKKVTLTHARIDRFFKEMHHDYLALRGDKKILLKPFLWGLVFTVADAGLFMIAFWALGQAVNPAPVLIAYGVASLAGFFVATPGGAGAYEALMVAFLAVAGIGQGVVIAGVVLARVIILLTTIVFGYVFYQTAIIKYGRQGNPPIQR